MLKLTYTNSNSVLKEQQHKVNTQGTGQFILFYYMNIQTNLYLSNRSPNNRMTIQLLCDISLYVFALWSTLQKHSLTQSSNKSTRLSTKHIQVFNSF